MHAETAPHVISLGDLVADVVLTIPKLPVHAEPGWLAKLLNPQHVILDVRDRAASSRAHIQGAVAMPFSELQAMTQRIIADQKVTELPGVSDQRAPIIVYADQHTSREALLAYKELRNWGYGRTTVLRDGFDGWQAAGLPSTDWAVIWQGIKRFGRQSGTNVLGIPAQPGAWIMTT